MDLWSTQRSPQLIRACIRPVVHTPSPLAGTREPALRLQTVPGVTALAREASSGNATTGGSLASAAAHFAAPSAACLATAALLVLLVYVVYEQIKFYLYR